MKIGIITYHHTTNYGATLQSYALWRYIKNQGFNVEIIDYRPRKAIDAYNKHLFSNKKTLIRNSLLFLNMRRFLLKNVKLSQKTIYKKTLLNQLSGEYDIVISGSDEVWNINSFRGFDSTFFLDFVDNIHTQTASYAASFGYTNNLGHNKDKISLLLSKFNYISARDSNTMRIIEETCGRKVIKVLDPTFLISEQYKDLIQNTKNKYINTKYVLIYGSLNKEESSLVSQFANYLNLTVISVGEQNSFADKNLVGISPELWLSLFQNASFIFTNFYHGLIFSIIFRKPFLVFERDTKSTKINDLLEHLKLKHRLFEKRQNFTAETFNQLAEEIYSLTIINKLNLETQVSRDYLSEVLSLTSHQ
jgi:polysaccharide pyruvyl transferase WcaK-like protein